MVLFLPFLTAIEATFLLNDWVMLRTTPAPTGGERFYRAKVWSIQRRGLDVRSRGTPGLEQGGSQLVQKRS